MIVQGRDIHKCGYCGGRYVQCPLDLRCPTCGAGKSQELEPERVEVAFTSVSSIAPNPWADYAFLALQERNRAIGIVLEHSAMMAARERAS